MCKEYPLESTTSDIDKLKTDIETGLEIPEELKVVTGRNMFNLYWVPSENADEYTRHRSSNS